MVRPNIKYRVPNESTMLMRRIWNGDFPPHAKVYESNEERRAKGKFRKVLRKKKKVRNPHRGRF